MNTLEQNSKVVAMMERVDAFKESVGKKYEISLFAEYGRKYCKIVRGNSVFCFIDLANGDVLYPKNWAQPEKKNPRSNIWSEDLGISGVNQYGTNYIR